MRLVEYVYVDGGSGGGAYPACDKEKGRVHFPFKYKVHVLYLLQFYEDYHRLGNGGNCRLILPVTGGGGGYNNYAGGGQSGGKDYR